MKPEEYSWNEREQNSYINGKENDKSHSRETS